MVFDLIIQNKNDSSKLRDHTYSSLEIHNQHDSLPLIYDALNYNCYLRRLIIYDKLTSNDIGNILKCCIYNHRLHELKLICDDKITLGISDIRLLQSLLISNINIRHIQLCNIVIKNEHMIYIINALTYNQRLITFDFNNDNLKIIHSMLPRRKTQK